MRSAALLVAERFDFPETNLRVDDHDDPVRELRRLWKAYEPQRARYVLRVVDPDAAT